MIRKAALSDISRIAEIIVFGKRVAYRSIFKDDNGSFNTLTVIGIIEEYQKHPNLLRNMLVYDDGIIKGVINRQYIEDYVEICDFYVEPFFKGMGIGSDLLRYVVEEAQMLPLKRIFLWVLEENVYARGFYEANGFSETNTSCFVPGTDKIDVGYEMILAHLF